MEALDVECWMLSCERRREHRLFLAVTNPPWKMRFADSVAESARIEGLGWVYKADSGPINSARVGRGGSLRQNPIKCRHR